MSENRIENQGENRVTVIRIVLGPTDDRVCDICNKTLVTWSEKTEGLVAMERCSATEFGLLCQECFDRAAKNAKKWREPFYIYAAWSEGEQYDWPY